MLKTYQHQVCIVTGSSSGIGEALARRLSESGAKVVLFARRGDRLHALAESLPGEALIVLGDVTQAQDRQILIEQTLDHWGRIDVLINNAGKDDQANFLKIAAAEAEQILQINLVSAILLTHAVVPVMVQQKHGLIINVSSAMGYLNYPRAALYGSSKAGLSAFSLSLYRELKPYGVHVMNFIPGYTRSEMIPEKVDAKLPRFVKVASASEVADLALKAALKGKPYAFSGEFIIRIAMWLNRNLPRVGDWLVTRIR